MREKEQQVEVKMNVLEELYSVCVGNDMARRGRVRRLAKWVKYILGTKVRKEKNQYCPDSCITSLANDKVGVKPLEKVMKPIKEEEVRSLGDSYLLIGRRNLLTHKVTVDLHFSSSSSYKSKVQTGL